MEAALPRPTLALRNVSLWVSKLMDFEWTLEMLLDASKPWGCDGVSLAKAYPGLPWHRKVFSYGFRK